jgi:hypothetical protein
MSIISANFETLGQQAVSGQERSHSRVEARPVPDPPSLTTTHSDGSESGVNGPETMLSEGEYLRGA